MSEQEQDENKLIALRREKLNEIRAKRNAFPNDCLLYTSPSPRDA